MEFIDSIYFSIYSLGRLPVLVYSSIICFYLLFHPSKSIQSRIMGFYFIFVVLFHFGFFIAYSSHHPIGSVGYYFTALSPIGISILLLFSYYFPRDIRKKERKIVFGIALFLSLISFFDYSFNAYLLPVKLFSPGYGSMYVSRLVPIVNTSLYLWILIVFIRKTLYHSKTYHGLEKKHLYHIFNPGGKEAITARNLSIIVLLEFLNSALLTSGLLFRSITYLQLLVWMNFSFFFIYSFYVILFLRYYSGSTPISFKLINFSLLSSLIFIVFAGNIQMYFSDKFFNEKRQLEINFLMNSLENKEELESISKFPGLEFIILWNKDGDRETVLKREGVSLPDKLNLWDRTPGLIEYDENRNDFNSKDLLNYNLKELYLRFSEKNIQFYPYLKNNKVYGFGFDYLEFRKFIHPHIKGTFYLFFYVLIINFIFLPLSLSKNFSQPFKQIINGLYEKTEMLLLPSSKKDIHNEIEILQETLQRVSDDIEEKKKVEIEIDKKNEEISFESEEIEEDGSNSTDTNTPLNEKNSEKIEKVKTYIGENFNFELSREGLASFVHLSPGRLGKYFKQATGLKISEYTNKLRIEKASELLIKTDKTILEIAFEVGFESLRTFNRVFSS
ncbi:MAG: helix-turn-helix transcriptional regulator, partial [Leptospiraceae bacterium]|nr:helix-turn-helix transcriptional regulator [Leptospiraceae bacterium]